MSKTNHKEKIKFLADKMLGRLAKWLRILGYDTTYSAYSNDLFVILAAREKNRVLLTRNTNLIKRKNICDFLFIKNDNWEEQLGEVIRGLKLKISLDSNLFSRCSICNTPTINIEKKIVRNHVPPYVFLNNNNFVYCPSCNKYYWKGTHWEKMRQRVQRILKK
ncbi:MAG: Mut7-C RNAse domain-containing protein [Candidatus Caldatribacteriota bacterium]|nr:Mut7-C RNAse domain-containing protein [Candidatus Caldatribacteriota bacterium]